VTSVTASAPLASSGGGTPNITLTGAVPVANGGTGATTGALALTNLGAQAAIVGAASTITASNLTASRALASDAAGKVVVSVVTSAELGFLAGVTSAVQTQLNSKPGTASPTFTGSVGIPAATVAAGVTTTADNDGNFTTGQTYIPTVTTGNMKRITNGSSPAGMTLVAPDDLGDFTMIIQITNGVSPGAITMSGFNRVIGNPFTTTTGHDFFVYITKLNGFLLANVVALQ
jgi:hypothetical protein